MIPPISELCDNITEKFGMWADTYERQAAQQRSFAAELIKHTGEYINTGITVFPAALAYAMESAGHKPRPYIRNLATLLKRPFIHAEYCSGSDLIELQVSRSDRLSDLVAGFILVAKELKGPPRWSPGDAPVFRCDTGGTWRVWFNTDVGKEIFDHFVNRVRTDPIARIILKLA